MRTTVFLVTDESDVAQKFRTQYETDPKVSLQIYSPQQWAEVLETPHVRANLHSGLPTLVTGLNPAPAPGGGHPPSHTSPVGGGAKVLQFPQPSSQKVEKMEELEAKAIEQAIFQFRGNLTEAAKALGIGRATLYRKVKQYNLNPSEARRKRVA